jgi:hypothetical protein
MGMLDSAASWLAGTLVDHASLSVVYSRGRTKTVTLSAVPGRPDGVRREPGLGRVKLDDERLDFHLRPADLDFGDGPVDPERGDRIAVNGLTREVSPVDGQPLFGRSDVFGHMIKVRTVLVS